MLNCFSQLQFFLSRKLHFKSQSYEKEKSSSENVRPFNLIIQF